jgi:hypothetical protein
VPEVEADQTPKYVTVVDAGKFIESAALFVTEPEDGVFQVAATRA